MLVQTALVNVDCRKAEWLVSFISCIIGCHTPARVVKEDEERRSEPHGTPKNTTQNSVVKKPTIQPHEIVTFGETLST